MENETDQTPGTYWNREYTQGEQSVLDWREEKDCTLSLRNIAQDSNIILRIEKSQLFEMMRKLLEKYNPTKPGLTKSPYTVRFVKKEVYLEDNKMDTSWVVFLNNMQRGLTIPIMKGTLLEISSGLVYAKNIAEFFQTEVCVVSESCKLKSGD